MMKKILTLFLLTTFCISALAQRKVKPSLIVHNSEITKKDKWINNFKIKNKRFNIYCGYEDLNSNLRHIKGDTLEVYKIVANKRKYSDVEIIKYATRNGKIIREGFYEIKNDTLTVVTNSYGNPGTFDNLGAIKTTTKYITDKYGLTMIDQEDTSSTNRELVSEKYAKPEDELEIKSEK